MFRRASTPKDIFVLYISVNGPKQKLQQTEECRDSKLRGSVKSLVRPTSQCILFDGENVSFDASFVIYI